VRLSNVIMIWQLSLPWQYFSYIVAGEGALYAMKIKAVL